MVSFVISANVSFDMDKENIFRSFFPSIDGVGNQNSLKPRRERRKRKQTDVDEFREELISEILWCSFGHVMNPLLTKCVLINLYED